MSETEVQRRMRLREQFTEIAGRAYIEGEERRLRWRCAEYQRVFQALLRWVKSWPHPMSG